MATVITADVVFNATALRWAPRHVEAVTLGTTIYVRGATITATQLAHERHHVRQFAERGVVRGVCEYLLLALLYGYRYHPWEREAQRAERLLCPAGHCRQQGVADVIR